MGTSATFFTSEKWVAQDLAVPRRSYLNMSIVTPGITEGPIDPASSPRQLSEAKNRQRRVLLVEDNPVNQEIARAVLVRAGCAVVLAEDGALAVAAWQAQEFDLVLMDCQMPVMDGMQATAQMRSLEVGRPRRTPIVALTANALEGDRERCLAVGMDDYLTKPFKRAELVAMLEHWCSGGEQTVP